MTAATAQRPLRLLTVGVYGFDGPSFIDALLRAGVETLLDVRQRRGVRGPQYAWANALRLQAALAEAGVAYAHLKQLAPTTELRQLQYAEDDRLGVGKRSRRELAAAYTARYRREILEPADMGPVLEALKHGGPAALLCVERDPEACHRSLIAERLGRHRRVKVQHLTPGGRA